MSVKLPRLEDGMDIPGDLTEEQMAALKSYLERHTEALTKSYDLQIRNLTDQQKTEFKKMSALYRNGYDQFKQKVESDLLEFAKTSRSQIELLAKAQHELAEIRPVVAAWARKRTGHLMAVIVLFASFVAVILSGIVYMTTHVPTFLFDFTLKGENGQITGVPTVIATSLAIAPVLGIAWICKVLSRMITMNLQGYEDAGLRRAVAETYINLLGTENSGVTKEERALALSALFRGSPNNTNSDPDILPPTWLDIIKGKD